MTIENISKKDIPTLEHGPLGIIVLNSCTEFGAKVNGHILAMRGEKPGDNDYIIPIDQIRFQNGEGKIRIQDSVRGKDIYILCDVGNYGCTYKMFNYINHVGPDEHFQDIKRVVSAIGGKANRVTVVMPLLYASRQHKRKGRESLDCAMALQELVNLGVHAIITFDAHDPTIQNAVPFISFENVFPTYTVLKYFFQKEGTNFNEANTLVISPDTGAMDRAIYYANVLGLDIGMFYKRRDHSVVINGKNPIIQHEYIGREIEGRNILIIDDMIASGDSVLDIIDQLKDRNVGKIYVACTFGFFTAGLEKFQKYADDGLLTRVYCTNGSYLPPELKDTPWFVEVDISKFVGKILNTLNHDLSMSPLLDSSTRIRRLLDEMGR